MPDGTVVTESNACYAHLAEALGFYGGLKDLQLLCMCMCTRNDMTDRCYNKAICPDRAAFEASFAKLLEGGPFAKYEVCTSHVTLTYVASCHCFTSSVLSSVAAVTQATLALSSTPFFCGDAPR